MGKTLDIDDVCAGNPVALSELRRLRKLASQRGARMQIIRDWMLLPRGIGPPTEWEYFVEERPDAKAWFDDEGVPVDA